MALTPGEQAPDFTLVGTDGEFCLREVLKSANVLLVFYPRDATPGCTRQLCEIRDSFPLYQLDQAQVVGVNPGSLASHQRFKERQGLPFPLLVDGGAQVSRAYGALKPDGKSIQRSVVLVGKDGQVIFSQEGMPPSEEILAHLE